LNILNHINIAGVKVHRASANVAAFWVLKRLNAGKRTKVTPVNAAVIVAASRDPIFNQSLKIFDLSIADGLWGALAASFLSRSRVPHANTSPFLRALFKQSSADCLRVFLLGARPEVVKEAAANFKTYHPNAKVVGYADGYFEPQEENRVVDLINNSGAQVLLIGISSPKKEYFVKDNWRRLNVVLSVGVGGQFDIWGGVSKRRLIG
jgi:N-acetylglucosaminyldiphosphoundecaprenol N-acetyl-beta-D-mannosaminyltransferase